MCRTPNRRTDAVLFALIVSVPLAVALSACNDPPATATSPPAAGGAATDACALLTAAEIEAATGITPGPPVDMSQSQLPMCNWPSADGSNPAFLTLMIGPSHNYTSYEDAIGKWAESAADMGFPFEEDDYQEVAGVGDVGAWMADAGTLQVHSGSTMIQVMTDVAEGRDKLEAARALAMDVDARLP